MKKWGRPGNQSNYISFERSYESYPKMQVLSNLSNFVKSYWHLSEILAFLTKITHQIWLNQVTPGANFGNL